MIDVLLYTIYIMLGLLVGLIIWSFVHQYTTHND